MDNRNVIVKWASCCRLCLLDDGIKLPIFEGEGIQRQIARKIQTCFPILVYVGDPLPKMICHKCLYKLDTVYDFRHKCLEANAILKKQLLTLTHMAEVKQYLDSLENGSASCVRKEPPAYEPSMLVSNSAAVGITNEVSLSCPYKFIPEKGWTLTQPYCNETVIKQEVTQKQLPLNLTPSVRRQVKIPQPVVPGNKDPVKEDKIGSAPIESSSENVFQEVFLADCSSDVFFPEQSPDETVEGKQNGNNLTKPSSREQTESIAPANPVRTTPANSSVDSATSSNALMIKQECEDETVKEDSPNEYKEPEKPVTSHLSPPRNDTLPHANLEPVSVDQGKVKQEKMDTTDIECSKCKIRFQGKRQLQCHVCTVVSRWSCEHCNKYFKSKDTLYKHKKYFCHKKRNNYVCKGCGKVFTTVIEMAQHQKVHLRVCLSLQEESLYTCTVCRKKFAARSMLEMHKKSHSSGNFYVNQVEGCSVQPVISSGKVPAKRFKCQYCPSSYTGRQRLKFHMKTHFVEEKNSTVPEWSVESKQTNKSDKGNDATPQANKSDKGNDATPQWLKKCSCKYCGHVCDDSAMLWLHMLQQHSSEQAYRCDKCGRSFSHQHAYTNHKKTHCVKIRCRMCRKPYSSVKALREHEYNKHSIQKATHHCRLCTESFVTRSALLIHGRAHHSKGKNDAPLLMEESERKVGTLPCSLCSEQFPSPMALVAHMQIHAGMGNRDMGNGSMGNLDQGPVPQSSCEKEEEHYPSLTCKICFRLFSSKSCLQRHIKVHATGKHVFYPCKICGKKFVSESTYKKHAATHMVSKSFHCPQCNKIFFREEMFKSHMCENSGKQACLTCGVLLTEEQHLNHVCDGSILKSSELPVKCSICSAVFSSIKARNNHMRIHGKQNTFITSLQPSKKSKCIKMSNGMYKCNICGKLMTTQQGAAGHARWHTVPQPVKPYKCPFCNRKYTTETALYTHIGAEHPEMPG